VGQSVQQVGEQVPGEDRGGGEGGERGQQGEVDGGGGLDGGRRDARPAEHGLHQQGAGDEFGDAGADQGEHGQQSGAQGVAQEHGAFGEAAGTGAAHRVLGEGVADALADVEREPGQLGHGEDAGGQHEVARELSGGDVVAAGVGEAAGRQDVQFQGEQPDGEQGDPEDRGGFQGVGDGGDRAVEEGAGAAGGQHAEQGAEQDGDGAGDGAQQRRPHQPFADDLGDGLAHHGGLAEVAGDGGAAPFPPAGGQRPVHAQVVPQPVQGLLVGAERGGARVRLHRVEGGG